MAKPDRSTVEWDVNVMELSRQFISNKRVRMANAESLSSSAFKRELGLRMIDEMINRAREKNIDKNGAKFKGYSDSYKKSFVFEVYGKDASDVNLTLSGEMLASMDVTKITDTGLKIAFISETQRLKAHGHINGIPSKKHGKVIRDFFGLPESQQKEIFLSTLKDFNRNEGSFNQAETVAQSDALSAEELVDVDFG